MNTGFAFALRLLCCVLGFAALLPAPVTASTQGRSLLPQYVHQQWSADRGFPGGKIQAITQTADGFLWIGTEQGLIQFDGQSFSATPASNAAAMPLAPILGLLTDDRGEVWIRVGRDALFRYSHGQLDDALLLMHNEDAVTAMCRTKDGSVLLNGLVNGIVRYHDGRFETLVKSNQLPSSPITSMVETADGRLWVGTQEQGVFSVKDGRVSPLNERLPSLKINSLMGVGNDIWIGTQRGIVRWDGAEITSSAVPPDLAHSSSLAMLKDRNGALWIGTDTGLYRLQEKRSSSAGNFTRMESAPVTALFEDREGNIWVGHADALGRVQESKFTTFGRNEGLSSDQIGPVYVDSENRVWFGLADGGLYQIDDGVPRVVPGKFSKDVVYSIAGRGNDLWIGSMRGGLTHLRIATGSTGKADVVETLTEKNGLAQNSVFAVYQARDGSVWAGTLNGGVSQWRDGHFRTFSTSNGLASNSISAITETSDGTTWVATSLGISSWSGDHWKSYGVPDGLPSETVNCLLEDSTGTLWIGTADGLASLAPGANRVVSHASGTLRGAVLGLATDQRGSLWVVTATAVLQVPLQKLRDTSATDADLREYGVSDGLPALAGVRRDRSVVTDGNGGVWIATSRGLAVIDPAQIEIKSLPTLTRIEGLSSNGSSIPLDHVHVPAGRQRITFSYAGLNLSSPESVRFRYKLEDFDQDWSEPTTERETVYTNLAPGGYRFHVIASDSEGRWTGSESILAFRVDPMFWQTVWFRLTLALTLFLVALGMYRLHLHSVAQRLNVRFEERLAERTRIAQDLHDTLLQGLLSASMQLNLADECLSDDSPAKPLVRRVLELMNRVSTEGRNVVRGLRSQGSDDLEIAFGRVRQELRVSELIDFRIVVEGHRRGLHPLIRDQAYSIGREALVNAFRHSQADFVEVKLGYEPSQLRLIFSDNGKGIDPEMLHEGRDGHWGLSGMRERAERIGARLKVSTRSSAGTEVELVIPDHIAFVSGKANRFKWISGFVQSRSRIRVPKADGEKNNIA